MDEFVASGGGGCVADDACSGARGRPLTMGRLRLKWDPASFGEPVCPFGRSRTGFRKAYNTEGPIATSSSPSYEAAFVRWPSAHLPFPAATFARTGSLVP